MALIALTTYCTEENQKASMLKRTLICLRDSVDLSRHRVIIVTNGSPIAAEIALGYRDRFMIIVLPENVGTARGINEAWQYRKPGEACIKMDDDVVIHSNGWADELEHAETLDPNIGIIGLKRKDCWERPDHVSDDFKSTLSFINAPGEKWVLVERVKHVIGTCQLYSPHLLDKIGYLYQPGLYGYDDVLAAHRCHIAGFYSCFLPHIEIDHIDPGDTPYQKWKEAESGESGVGPKVREIIREYYKTRDVYVGLY